MVYDVIIIGAGPAGITAGIYARRACLNFLILQDKYSTGSQICSTYEVCNYPGLNNISGQELYDKMKNHIIELGVSIKDEKVIELKDEKCDIKKIITSENTYECRSIILATGGTPKKAGFEDEDKYVGCGISYCATCDGAFYKDKVVAVIGGGDVAVEDAIFLSRIAKKVYLIVRKKEMRATKLLQDEVKNIANVEIMYETEALSIVANDNDKFVGLILKNVNDRIGSEYSFDGVFVGIGMSPDNSLVSGKVLMDGEYIVADETCETSIKGVYAIGDIRKKLLRQVITACADGANAVTSVIKFLYEKK